MLSLQSTDLSQPVAKFVTPVTSALRASQTVAQGMEALRSRTIDAKVFYFYVTDDEDKLRGVIQARKLLLSDPQAKIGELMDNAAISIPATATLADAMEYFAVYRLLALPVVDEESRLIGQVDVQLYADEAVDLAEAERLNDLFQFIGLSLQQFKQGSAWVGFRRRMPWLAGNVVSGVLCAIIAAVFKDVLGKVLLLAMFIPLVLTLSESISMQAMTLVLQYLRGPRPPKDRLVARARIEYKTALLLGAGCGVLVAFAAMLWGQGPAPAVVIGVSILCSMFASATVGTLLPILIHSLRLDPKLAAGPVVLMAGDIMTTTVYLGLATLWLT